jgi:hypothetical protein
MTRPFLARREYRWLILPARQCAFRSARLAILSFLPFSFGTMQARGLCTGAVSTNVAVADWGRLAVKVQVPLPVQAPDQPVNLEPVRAVAFKVTLVP